jgi:hypothetical protein
MNERPTIDSITFETSLDHIPNPSPEVWAKFGALIDTLAPDLRDMVWDERAATGGVG